MAEIQYNYLITKSKNKERTKLLLECSTTNSYPRTITSKTNFIEQQCLEDKDVGARYELTLERNGVPFYIEKWAYMKGKMWLVNIYNPQEIWVEENNKYSKRK
jgi:hypothetical protein